MIKAPGSANVPSGSASAAPELCEAVAHGARGRTGPWR
jgi:hypothetical protein